MKTETPALFCDKTFLHRPTHEIFNGLRGPHPDRINRVDQILQSLKSTTSIEVLPVDCPVDEQSLFHIHDADYLNFLRDLSDYAAKISARDGNDSFAIYPSIHPYVSYGEANNSISRRGQHFYDTYTPVMSKTYEVAASAAGLAVEGSRLILSGEDLVYCLTRPAGHHALKALSGGMCYLNNAAIAAEYLSLHGKKRLAILDLDFHHGNGTQDIFYNSSQVYVANIHGDPASSYPHFTGYRNEIGIGEGKGFNVNFPLPHGTNNELYRSTLEKALQLIRKFQPECLIVSAGFDTHENDPSGKFSLTTMFYEEMGQEIKRLDLQTLIVQEGGYGDALGENVVSFLLGMQRR
jgi:acetoin utilization deacetylase AcuC-like enzyme